MMKVCLITNFFSPHQMPFARSLANRLGEAAFRYIVTERVNDERKNLGWKQESHPVWLMEPYSNVEASKEATRWTEEADVIICGNRDLNCFEQRIESKQLTFYMSERWFKPPIGMLRLLSPAYFRMALRFCRLLCSPSFFYLPIGIHAANDMLRLGKLFATFSQYVSRHLPLATHQLQSKMLLWGYFVEPSSMLRKNDNDELSGKDELLNILWVGRLLNWKRVDTLIKAVAVLLDEGRNIRLTLIGHGSEEPGLRKLAETLFNRRLPVGKGKTNELMNSCKNEPPPILFHPSVPIAQVREFMHQSDVYVLPSDGGEGWGAVLNEAMEEGCAVIATRECGSGETMIKDGENGLLFNAGDVNGLVRCLTRLQDDPELRSKVSASGRKTVVQLWNPEIAAERLLSVCDALLYGRKVPSFTDGPMMSIPYKIGSKHQA